MRGSCPETCRRTASAEDVRSARSPALPRASPARGTRLTSPRRSSRSAAKRHSAGHAVSSSTTIATSRHAATISSGAMKRGPWGPGFRQHSPAIRQSHRDTAIVPPLPAVPPRNPGPRGARSLSRLFLACRTRSFAKAGLRIQVTNRVHIMDQSRPIFLILLESPEWQLFSARNRQKHRNTGLIMDLKTQQFRLGLRIRVWANAE